MVVVLFGFAANSQYQGVDDWTHSLEVIEVLWQGYGFQFLNHTIPNIYIYIHTYIYTYTHIYIYHTLYHTIYHTIILYSIFIHIYIYIYIPYTHIYHTYYIIYHTIILYSIAITDIIIQAAGICQSRPILSILQAVHAPEAWPIWQEMSEAGSWQGVLSRR